MIIRTVSLSCDRCLNEADPSFPTAHEMRGWARANGWRLLRSGDLCPDCATLTARTSGAVREESEVRT